jgi:hypothetical protein
MWNARQVTERINHEVRMICLLVSLTEDVIVPVRGAGTLQEWRAPAALGISSLPVTDQQRALKRLEDRVRKQLFRRGS